MLVLKASTVLEIFVAMKAAAMRGFLRDDTISLLDSRCCYCNDAIIITWIKLLCDAAWFHPRRMESPIVSSVMSTEVAS